MLVALIAVVVLRAEELDTLGLSGQSLQDGLGRRGGFVFVSPTGEKQATPGLCLIVRPPPRPVRGKQANGIERFLKPLYSAYL